MIRMGTAIEARAPALNIVGDGRIQLPAVLDEEQRQLPEGRFDPGLRGRIGRSRGGRRSTAHQEQSHNQPYNRLSSHFLSPYLAITLKVHLKCLLCMVFGNPSLGTASQNE